MPRRATATGSPTPLPRLGREHRSTPACSPTTCSWVTALGRCRSQATSSGVWPWPLSQSASLPASVVLPEPCRPASMITVGGFLANVSRRVSPPRIATSSSLTILMTCCAGFSACGDLGAAGPLLDRGDERAHHRQRDVRLEQRDADLPAVASMSAGVSRPLPRSSGEDRGEPVGEGVEHVGVPRSWRWWSGTTRPGAIARQATGAQATVAVDVVVRVRARLDAGAATPLPSRRRSAPRYSAGCSDCATRPASSARRRERPSAVDQVEHVDRLGAQGVDPGRRESDAARRPSRWRPGTAGRACRVRGPRARWPGRGRAATSGTLRRRRTARPAGRRALGQPRRHVQRCRPAARTRSARSVSASGASPNSRGDRPGLQRDAVDGPDRGRPDGQPVQRRARRRPRPAGPAGPAPPP